MWHVEPTFFEHRPEAFQRPTQRRSALRIPLGEAFGAGAGTRSVEIAKDVTPTIGMHAIQLPAGDATEKPRETANNIYGVVSDTVRAAIDGQEDEMLGRGDVLAVPLRQGRVLRGIEDATLLRARTSRSDEVRFAAPRLNAVSLRQWLGRQPRCRREGGISNVCITVPTADWEFYTNNTALVFCA